MPRSMLLISGAAALMMLAGTAWCDRCSTGMYMPGWSVLTTEDAWANSGLADGVKKYPITNLLDGDVTTAWVFEGPKWDGKENESGYRPPTDAPFRGGVGQTISIETHMGRPPVVDAVGIVNGYAKNATTYERSNRVTRMRVRAYGTQGKEIWSRSFDLRQVMWMQVFSVPGGEVTAASVTVEAVALGRDNDLCISEIQLYRSGRSVIPKPPAYVISSPGDECGCGYAVSVTDTKGHIPIVSGRPATWETPSFAFSSSGMRAAVAGYQVGSGAMAVTAIELTTGDFPFDLTTPQYLDRVRWESDSLLVFSGEAKTGEVTDYRVDLSRHPPAASKMARSRP